MAELKDKIVNLEDLKGFSDYVENKKANKEDISVPYNFKGSCLYSQLPLSGNSVNDTYYVTDKKCKYSWGANGAWYQSSMDESDYTDELNGIIAEKGKEIGSTKMIYEVGTEEVEVLTMEEFDILDKKKANQTALEEQTRRIDELNKGGLNINKEAINASIVKWLAEHPEATTTVKDYSLNFKKMIIGTFNFVIPEMYGAVGDGVTDDTSAFASIPENSYIIGKIDAIYKVNKVRLTNCIVENCTFIHDGYEAGSTEETKRTYMINAYESTFRNCTFRSTCNQVPYLDNTGLGKASNVVGIILRGNTTVIVDNCNFYDCYGISLSNSTVIVSNSNLICEMGIYADGDSSITLNNTNITVLACTLSVYYHALYIPQLKSFVANGCNFEMQSGNTNCGNIVHFYSPNVSSYTDNKAYFNNCTFKGLKSLFRLYIKTIFSGCVIETTEINSSESLILATSKSLYEPIFTDCRFNLMSCRFNVNSVFVKNSDITVVNGTLYQGTDSKPNYFIDCNFYLGNYNIILNSRNDNASKITYWINCNFYTNKTNVGIKDYQNQSIFKAYNCYSFGSYDKLFKTNSLSVEGITVV